MTRHLLRLMWNRKRQNVLLALEIFLSFVVVLAVVALAINYANNWRQPIGYSIDNVWTVELQTPLSDGPLPGAAEVYQQLFTSLKELPDIEQVAAVAMAPYEQGSSGRSHTLQSGRLFFTSNNVADDNLAAVLNIELVAGRWFDRRDDAASEAPVVINERLARELFDDTSAVGQVLPIVQRRGRDGVLLPPRERVVGVIRDFRQHGELETPQNYLFQRASLRGISLNVGRGREMRFMVFRVAPGTAAAFEETIVKRLHEVARDWTFDVRSLASDRERSQRSQMLVPLVGAFVAGFLLLMVLLGLTGITWQNITVRTLEYGLRRAKGATGSDVRRQVLAELAIVASFALVPGVLLAIQIPALPLPANEWVIPTGIFLAAVAVSVAAVYLVVLACGLYPSRLATQIQPADALRYE